MSMWLVVSALVFVLVSSSCGPAPATLRPSTAPSPAPYLSYLPRPATIVTPEPPSSPGPIGFSCRLPIYRLDSKTPPQSQVGFLSVPAGSVTLQPAPALPAGSVAGPNTLYPSAFYYDRPFSRWVPAARGSLSPDGSHYAYPIFTAIDQEVMRIVDVATGDVRSYPATHAEFKLARYVVVDYAKEGIYLGLAYEGPISGLWLMDPNTGAIRDVAGLPSLQAIAGSAVWLGNANPADPNPAPGGLGPAADTVDRFDLVTGSHTPWLYLPGSVVQVVAVDTAGHALVLVWHGASDNAELLLLTSPGAAQQIFHGTRTELGWITAFSSAPAWWDMAMRLGSPIADSHGVWFGSPSGIYLYSPSVGMRKVSDQAGYPGNQCMP